MLDRKRLPFSILDNIENVIKAPEGSNPLFPCTILRVHQRDIPLKERVRCYWHCVHIRACVSVQTGRNTQPATDGWIMLGSGFYYFLLAIVFHFQHFYLLHTPFSLYLHAYVLIKKRMSYLCKDTTLKQTWLCTTS